MLIQPLSERDKEFGQPHFSLDERTQSLLKILTHSGSNSRLTTASHTACFREGGRWVRLKQMILAPDTVHVHVGVSKSSSWVSLIPPFSGFLVQNVETCRLEEQSLNSSEFSTIIGTPWPGWQANCSPMCKMDLLFYIICLPWTTAEVKTLSPSQNTNLTELPWELNRNSVRLIASAQ